MKANMIGMIDAFLIFQHSFLDYLIVPNEKDFGKIAEVKRQPGTIATVFPDDTALLAVLSCDLPRETVLVSVLFSCAVVLGL